MQESTKNKLLYIALPILLIFVIAVVALISNLQNLNTGSSLITKELDKKYDISLIATNQATQQDTITLTQKLNNNAEVIINNLINTQLPSDFRFEEDIELTNNEFCQMLNIVVNSFMQDNNSIQFIQCDVSINENSNIQRTNIKTYALIDVSFIKEEFNININNNILVVNQYVKNQNNITNAEHSKTISVNSITSSTASNELKNMFFDTIFADIFDEIIQQIQSTFNCYIEFKTNSVKIYA